jgi:FG-GAP repeat protein
VFVRSGTTWSPQATLTASDGAPFHYFGAAVAMSGSTAVIGGYGAFGTFAGAAYVFTRSGTTWTQKKKLTASDAGAGDHLGQAVAIDGSTIVAGALGHSSSTGAAYIFVGSGTTWTQQAKLTASAGAPNDIFGASVAISGQNALVGAPGTSTSTGAAYVFSRAGTSWTQQPALTASDAAVNDRFGESVGISGNIAVIGADGKNSNAGASYVFSRSGSGWAQQASPAASDGSCCQYGAAVAISGSTALVGEPTKNGAWGAAYVYDLGLIAQQSPPGSPSPHSDGVNQSPSGTPGSRVPAAKRRVNRTITSTSEAVGSAESGRSADGWLRFVEALLIR